MIFSFICLLLKNLKIPTGHFNKEKGQGKSFIFEIKSSAFYSNIGNNCCICQEDSHIENFFLSTPCVSAYICKFPPLIKDEISLKEISLKPDKNSRVHSLTPTFFLSTTVRTVMLSNFFSVSSLSREACFSNIS